MYNFELITILIYSDFYITIISFAEYVIFTPSPNSTPGSLTEEINKSCIRSSKRK